MIYNNQLNEYTFSPLHNEVLKILLPWKKEYWQAVSLRKNELKQEIQDMEKHPVTNVRRIKELKELKSKLTDRAIKSVKDDIKEYLFFEQKGRCYYCEGEFFKNRTGVGEPTIDHIADKATYPHYLYISKNLVLACKECNGFNKKGTKNVIVAGCTKTIYQDLDSNDFTFVHPYLDIKEEHMDYDEDNNVWITINDSEKGKRSICIFGLNESYNVLERFKSGYSNISEQDELSLEKITNYSE